MIPHHESAVQMAQIAQRRGSSDFVKKLADDIVAAQQREIAEMREHLGEKSAPDNDHGDDDSHRDAGSDASGLEDQSLVRAGSGGWVVLREIT